MIDDRLSTPPPATSSAPGRATRDTFSISDLAREFGITTRTIRFYEDCTLIEPARQGRKRVYTARDRVRLKLILRGKRLGFSLREIGEILDMYDHGSGEAAQLEYILEKLTARRAQLERQRRDIEVTLAEMQRIESECRVQLAAVAGGVRR